MDYDSGALLTTATTADKIDDLQNFLDYLPDNHMDVALLKRLGINGKNGNHAKATKIEWTETALRPREEVLTAAADNTTSIVVADSGIYQIGELLKWEAEVVRITAKADATHITITRGMFGTAAAAHAAKLAVSLGIAAEENSTPGAGIFDTPAEKYNYVQTFDVPVEVSKDQIMSITVDGNTLDGQLERRFIEVNRQLARASLYGVRGKTGTPEIRAMNGIVTQLLTNATSVGGALTKAAIDAAVLAQTNAGGMPKILALSPYQKQKLDALDDAKQMLGKNEHTGGGLITNTWQTGVLNYALDVVVDRTILKDQVLLLDPDMLEIMPFAGNGETGAWGTYNASANGQDGTKKVIRGKYTNKVHNEKAHALLYGLS